MYAMEKTVKKGWTQASDLSISESWQAKRSVLHSNSQLMKWKRIWYQLRSSLIKAGPYSKLLEMVDAYPQEPLTKVNSSARKKNPADSYHTPIMKQNISRLTVS